MKLKILFLTLIVLLALISSENSFATSEPIFITKSPNMDKVIFDGRWTNYVEWKQSSHNQFVYDDGEMLIHLRTAHQGDYIYVFVNPVYDLTLDKKMDQATVCFDAENNKSKTFDKNDFCFSITLENDKGQTFQGPLNENSKTVMKQIDNHENFIAISSVSDKNDHYTENPHPSYEFKIPIELLERSDNYGFYFSVYDASVNKVYSYPENVTRINSEIPIPSMWGDIISPDKSLPEMNLPIMILAILIVSIILVQSKAKITFLR